MFNPTKNLIAAQIRLIKPLVKTLTPLVKNTTTAKVITGLATASAIGVGVYTDPDVVETVITKMSNDIENLEKGNLIDNIQDPAIAKRDLLENIIAEAKKPLVLATETPEIPLPPKVEIEKKTFFENKELKFTEANVNLKPQENFKADLPINNSNSKNSIINHLEEAKKEVNPETDWYKYPSQRDRLIQNLKNSVNKSPDAININLSNPLLTQNDFIYLYENKTKFSCFSIDWRVGLEESDHAFFVHEEYHRLKQMEAIYAQQNKNYSIENNCINSKDYLKQERKFLDGLVLSENNHNLNNHNNNNDTVNNQKTIPGGRINQLQNPRRYELMDHLLEDPEPETAAISVNNENGNLQMLLLEQPQITTQETIKESNRVAQIQEQQLAETLAERLALEQELINEEQPGSHEVSQPQSVLANPKEPDVRLVRENNKFSFILSEELRERIKNIQLPRIAISEDGNSLNNQTLEDSSYIMRKLEEAQNILDNDPVVMDKYWREKLQLLTQERESMEKQHQEQIAVLEKNRTLSALVENSYKQLQVVFDSIKSNLEKAYVQFQKDTAVNRWIKRASYFALVAGFLYTYKEPITFVIKEFVKKAPVNPVQQPVNVNVNLGELAKVFGKTTADVVQETTTAIVTQTAKNVVQDTTTAIVTETAKDVISVPNANSIPAEVFDKIKENSPVIGSLIVQALASYAFKGKLKIPRAPKI